MGVFRCILAGVASLMVGAILLVVCMAVGLNLVSGGQGAISVDVTALTRSPSAWMAAVLLFGPGFWVESRRGK